MTKTRAALFEDDNIDLSTFKVEAKPETNFPSKSDVKNISEQSGFSSREPDDHLSSDSDSKKFSDDLIVNKRKPYNSTEAQKVQLNIRVSQEVADAFYRITKDNEWDSRTDVKEGSFRAQKEISNAN